MRSTAVVLDRGREVSLSPEAYEEIRENVDRATDRYVRELKALRKQTPTQEHIETFKRALFEAEVETYPIVYLIKSKALERRFEVLTNR